MAKKQILRMMSFMFITIIVISILGLFFNSKTVISASHERSYDASRVLLEPSDSIDVLFVGHSGVYRGISPMEMYKNYGFTSYNLSQSVQLPSESYELIKTTLKIQNPRLIVLEVDQLFYDQPHVIPLNYLGQKLNKVFPIFANHTGWKNFKDKHKQKVNPLKGYRPSHHVKSYEGNKKMIKTDKIYKIKKIQMSYLEKIYELCLEKNVSLMLLEIPSMIRWDYEKYNAIEKFASDKGINFIDANQELEKFLFDWKKDTPDKGDHLNHQGAVKLSKYLGDYISKEFNLVDRRLDEKYINWKRDLQLYEQIIKKRGIA